MSKIQYLYDANFNKLGQTIGMLVKNEDSASVIEVVIPFSGVTKASFNLLNGSKKDVSYYMAKQLIKGKDVVDPNSEYYQELYNADVYQVEVRNDIVKLISMHHAEEIGVAFAFISRTSDSSHAITNKGYFGSIPLPTEDLEVGDFYVCDRFNYNYNDVLYTKGDVAYWNGTEFKKDKNYTVRKTTNPTLIPVAPSIFANPNEEPLPDIEQLWEAINNNSDAINDLYEVMITTINPVETQTAKINVSKSSNTYNMSVDVKIDPNPQNLLGTTPNGLIVHEEDVIDDIIEELQSDTPLTQEVVEVITQNINDNGNVATSVRETVKDGYLSKDALYTAIFNEITVNGKDTNTAIKNIIELLVQAHNENPNAHLDIRILIENLQKEIDRIDARGRSWGEIGYSQTQLEAMTISVRNSTIENWIINNVDDNYSPNTGDLIYTRETTNNNVHEWEYNGNTGNWVDNGAYVIDKASNTQYGIVTGNDYISFVSGLAQVLKSDYAVRIGTGIGTSYTYDDLVSLFVRKDVKNTFTQPQSVPNAVNDDEAVNLGQVKGKINDAPNDEFKYVRSKNDWEKLIIKEINRAYPDETRQSGMTDVGDGWYRIGNTGDVTLDWYPSLAEKGIQRYRLNGTRIGSGTSLIINENNATQYSSIKISEISGQYTYSGSIDSTGGYIGNGTTGYVYLLPYIKSVFINSGEMLRLTLRNGNSFTNWIFDLTVIFPEEKGMGFAETPDSDGRTKAIKDGEWGNVFSNPSYKLHPYWINYLDTKVELIQETLELVGRNRSSFYWYTDAHWTVYNTKATPDILKYMYDKTTITKTNFGGDIVGELANTRDEMKWLYDDWRLNIKSIPNHHSVVGNHDMFNTKLYATPNWTYTFLIEPEETPNMVVGGDFYYYIDNPSEKTRYFYLSTGKYSVSNKEAEFFIDALENIPNGWHVVAISHIWFTYTSSSNPTVGTIPPYVQAMLDLFDAFNAKESGDITLNSTLIPYDFTNVDGKVAFCIGGHIHYDWHFFTDGGIPVILTPPNARQPRGDAPAMIEGTTNETSIASIICDYEKEKIYMYYLGAGTDKIIEYGNPEPTINNVLDIVGWTDNTRVNSSGNVVSFTGVDTTGLIEFTKGDVIRLKNIVAPANDTGSGYSSTIGIYDGSGTYIVLKYLMTTTASGTQIQGTFDGSGNCYEFTLNGTFIPANGYIRITANNIDNTSIITVNELIP